MHIIHVHVSVCCKYVLHVFLYVSCIRYGDVYPERHLHIVSYGIVPSAYTLYVSVQGVIRVEHVIVCITNLLVFIGLVFVNTQVYHITWKGMTCTSGMTPFLCTLRASVPSTTIKYVYAVN